MHWYRGSIYDRASSTFKYKECLPLTYPISIFKVILCFIGHARRVTSVRKPVLTRTGAIPTLTALVGPCLIHFSLSHWISGRTHIIRLVQRPPLRRKACDCELGWPCDYGWEMATWLRRIPVMCCNWGGGGNAVNPLNYAPNNRTCTNWLNYLMFSSCAIKIIIEKSG